MQQPIQVTGEEWATAIRDGWRSVPEKRGARGDAGRVADARGVYGMSVGGDGWGNWTAVGGWGNGLSPPNLKLTP